MKQLEEIEALRDIPGYKTALKAVLKSQIQYLAEQLSQETEEETVILSASTADGTLSRLGSLHGKDFLQDKDDIQFQFLQHCLQKKGLAPCISEGRTALMDSTQTFEDDASVSPPLLLRKTSESMLGESHTSITDVTGKETNKLLITIAKTGQSKHSVRLKRKKETSGLSKRLKKSSSKSQVDTVVDKSFEETDIFAIADASTTQLRCNTDTGNTTSDTEIKVESLIKETSDIVGEADMAVDSNAEVKSEPKSDNEDDFAAEAPSSDDEQLESLSKEETIQEAEEGQPSKDLIFLADFKETKTLKAVPGKPSIKTRTSDDTSGKRPCEYCGRFFSNSNNLKRHIRLHTNDFKFRCSICSRFFDSDSELENHNKAKHQTGHLCMTCGKTFKTKSRLSDHSAQHGNTGKSFACPVPNCNKFFQRQAQYEDHLNIHSGSFPFSCKNCGKMFKSRYTKARHEGLCLGLVEKKKCDICFLEFNTASALKIHVDGKHLNKVHFCDCGKDFKYYSTLSRHRRTNNH